MTGDDDLEFECESCGTMFRGTLYGIDRELEKVIFASENVPEVDIRGVIWLYRGSLSEWLYETKEVLRRS